MSQSANESKNKQPETKIQLEDFSQLERYRHYWVLYTNKIHETAESIRAYSSWFTAPDGKVIPLNNIKCLVPIPDSMHLEEIIRFIADLSNHTDEKVANKAKAIMEQMPWFVLQRYDEHSFY